MDYLKSNRGSARRNAIRCRSNRRGIAILETASMLILFVIMIAYTFGAFGIVHTGILNSIAARAYAFETFRQRANLTYFRDSPDRADDGLSHYRLTGNRQHGIKNEKSNDNLNQGFRSTERSIRMGFGTFPATGSRNQKELHNMTIFSDVQDNVQNSREVTPVWIMVQYGMCMTAQCGDQQ